MPSALSFLNTTWSSNYYPIKVVVYAQVCSNFAVWQEELLFAQYYSIVVKSFGQCCSLLSSGKKSLLTSKKRKSVCALGAIVKAPSLPVPVCSSSGVYKQGAIDVTRQLWRVMMRIGGHHYHCQYQYLPLSYTTLPQSSLRQSIYEPLHHYFGVCVFALSSHIAFIYSVLTVPWLHISFSQAECEDLCSTRLNLFNSSLCIITVWYCNFYSRAFDSHYQQQNSFLFLRWI